MLKRPARAASTKRAPRAASAKSAARAASVERAPRLPRRATTLRTADLALLRRHLDRLDARASRWNPDADDVQRSVARLVLALVEFIRRLLERQVLRRMKRKTLTAAELESLGVALMQLEATVRDMAARFDIPFEELNLDLGPLGTLL